MKPITTKRAVHRMRALLVWVRAELDHIETMKLKLMTMAAMLMAERRGVALSWAMATADGALAGTGRRLNNAAAKLGINRTVPSRTSAIAA